MVLMGAPSSREIISGSSPQNEVMLGQQVAFLEAQMQQQAREVRELQTVVATKDEVIRSLGSKLAAATAANKLQGLREVDEKGDELSAIVRAKDDIIRVLSSKLCDEEHGETMLERVCHNECEEQPRQTFTVMPMKSSCDQQLGDWELARRIEDFMNQRRSKILFTHLHDGYFLYGRLLVHCVLTDDDEDDVTVARVLRDATNWPRCCDGQLPLSEFVALHEDEEHACFEQLWAAPR